MSPNRPTQAFTIAVGYVRNTSIRDIQSLASVRIGEVSIDTGVTGLEGYEALDSIRQTILPPRAAPHCCAERDHRARSPAGPLAQ
jgi:hypothetical protein